MKSGTRVQNQGVVPGGSEVVPGEVVPGSPSLRSKEEGGREPGTPRKPEPLNGTTSRNHPVPRETNVRGNSNDPARGAWCTSKPWADALGRFDVDPFSNPRSHIQSDHHCTLEGGGDGFGDGTPGWYRTDDGQLHYATGHTSTFWQPPYRKGFVERVFKHYKHTRWTALLRFDPRPPWWQMVYDASELVAVVEIEFEPPPGVKDIGGNSFPHAIYYRCAEDITPDVLRMAAAVWRKKAKT